MRIGVQEVGSVKFGQSVFQVVKNSKIMKTGDRGPEVQEKIQKETAA